MSFSVPQSGGQAFDFDDINKAINLAREMVPSKDLPGSEDIEPVTVHVLDKESGRPLAAVTNRRISGEFIRQAWGGHSGDDAITVGVETFDATVKVLSLSHEELITLSDSSTSTDEIGMAFVNWDGPFEVRLVDQVRAFFGVEQLRDITPEVHEFMRRECSPEPVVSVTLEIAVKVRVTKPLGTSIDDFISELDYNLASTTPGVEITETELAGAHVLTASVRQTPLVL